MAQKYVRNDKTGQYEDSGVAEMAASPISVRLPTDVDAKVRAMPNRTQFLREVIAKAVKEQEDFKSV